MPALDALDEPRRAALGVAIAIAADRAHAELAPRARAGRRVGRERQHPCAAAARGDDGDAAVARARDRRVAAAARGRAAQRGREVRAAEHADGRLAALEQRERAAELKEKDGRPPHGKRPDAKARCDLARCPLFLVRKHVTPLTHTTTRSLALSGLTS